MTVSSSPARALGWKKQPFDVRDHDAVKVMLAGAPSVNPVSATNADLVKIVDQGGLGSCTANGSGQAVRAAEILETVESMLKTWTEAGNDRATFDVARAISQAQSEIEFWARLFPYLLARAYEGTIHQDAGANIRDIFKAINKYGYVPESVLPYNDNSDPMKGPTPFSEMPSADVFRQAYDQRASALNIQANLVDYALILETGDARIDVIKTAISQRHLVVFGTLVSENFCSDMSAQNGAPIAPPSDPNGADIAGGHCMAVGSYDQDGAGIINSWSTAFGGRGGLPPGFCKFSWNYMKWQETTDLWIVRRAPIFYKAES